MSRNEAVMPLHVFARDMEGEFMKASKPIVYIVLAVALVVIGAVGYAIWRDSQTNTFEMNIGDETLRIETEG